MKSFANVEKAEDSFRNESPSPAKFSLSTHYLVVASILVNLVNIAISIFSDHFYPIIVGSDQFWSPDIGRLGFWEDLYPQLGHHQPPLSRPAG